MNAPSSTRRPRAQRPLVAALCLLLVASGVFTSAARAAVIGTEAAIAADSRAAQLDRVHGALDRQEVRERLEALGVDRADLDARLAALTDRELAQLAQGIDSQPAGGFLAVIGIVFLVLIVLEYVGAIDIFKKVP
ncbi:MAG: PA2779 family protein [Steroidobacteraceae bacterium]